jgi:hypothetical protein
MTQSLHDQPSMQEILSYNNNACNMDTINNNTMLNNEYFIIHILKQKP